MRHTDHELNNRHVETKLDAAALARLKHLVLKGHRNREIAELLSLTTEAVEIYLRKRRPRWLAEAIRSRLEDDRRIVKLVQVARPSGSYDLRPISLPRISMHVAYLAEQAHG